MAATAAVLFRCSLLIFYLLVCYSSTSVVGIGGKVGGWEKVKNVKTNKEVQDLGKFSVEQYNSNKQKYQGKGGINNNDDLTYKEVVEAQTQVVSGIKYFLKIAAVDHGVPKKFDAYVVVKPWLHSKDLLTFAPSAN